MSRRASSISGLCVEAAVGGLSTLAAVPEGALAKDRALRRLLVTVTAEAAAAAGLDARSATRLAVARCRRNRDVRHPWQAALRRRRPTGAAAVLRPFLASPRMRLIAAVIRRLERAR